MKTMARHWEEQFDELMKDGRTGQYRERLEWFLFKLHLAVQTVETQSDGTQLLIFCDGSVYSEEAELDALLALAPRRNSGRKDNQTQFACGSADQKRCRKGQAYVGRVQRRG
jgi:hypothetical protein